MNQGHPLCHGTHPDLIDLTNSIQEEDCFDEGGYLYTAECTKHNVRMYICLFLSRQDNCISTYTSISGRLLQFLNARVDICPYV